MDKSMYSLMLMDSLVEKVDQLAYEKGTNRSNLINQILAEYLSETTPEMRMSEIFDRVAGAFQKSAVFQITEMPKDAMLSIKSSLRYKYRPTMRYAVELYRQGGDCFGELRVVFRTKSPELLRDLRWFFSLWVALEKKYLTPVLGENSIRYVLEDGRFRRTLLLPEKDSQRTSEALGTAITDYIRMFDDCLKFAVGEQRPSNREVEERYRAYLKKGITLV